MYSSVPTSLAILVIMPTERLLESVNEKLILNKCFWVEEMFDLLENKFSRLRFESQTWIVENLQRCFRCDKREEVRNLYKLLRYTVLDGAAATAHTESSTANADLWHVDRSHKWRFFYYVFLFFDFMYIIIISKCDILGKVRLPLCIEIEYLSA